MSGFMKWNGMEPRSGLAHQRKSSKQHFISQKEMKVFGLLAAAESTINLHQFHWWLDWFVGWLVWVDWIVVGYGPAQRPMLRNNESKLNTKPTKEWRESEINHSSLNWLRNEGRQPQWSNQWRRMDWLNGAPSCWRQRGKAKAAKTANPSIPAELWAWNWLELLCWLR